MIPNTTAFILILLAIIAQLLWMSGWVIESLIQPFQLMSLGLMLITLFVLRKKKRKVKKRTRRQPAEGENLVDKTKQDGKEVR